MSGSGTSVGIEYQQRVAGWFLVSLILQIDVSQSVSMSNPVLISQIAFETDDKIDDLVLTCKNNDKVYLQIKRTVNLSIEDGSDLYKTTAQFVRQYLEKTHISDKYVLVTSSKSSSKITRDLRKIIESIKLNELNFSENPLNDSEKETIEKYKLMVHRIFEKQTKEPLDEKTFIEFTKRISISVMDIESGMVLENAILLYLNKEFVIDPVLIWGMILKDAAFFSSNRMSVNEAGLNHKYQSFFRRNNANNNQLDEGFIKIIFDEMPICSGKEVLLTKNCFEENDDYLIFELYRFEDDGRKRVVFTDDNKCTLKNGMKLEVIHRCATNTGMERYITNNEKQFKDKKVFIIPAKGIEDVESNDFVKSYSELCLHLLKSRKNILSCLHCSKPVSENGAPIVELDDIEYKNVAGLVHEECLRPIDRVLGVINSKMFMEYSYLKKFDYEKWLHAIQKSKSAIFKAKDFHGENIKVFAWNPDVEYDESYNYCIKIGLNDGSSEYVKRRGIVQRFKNIDADNFARNLNEQFKQSKEIGNPVCYTSQERTFGMFSTLLRTKRDDERCIECIDAQAVKYTQLIGDIYGKDNLYYTPIALLINARTEEPININGYAVLISDPLCLNNFIENWSKSNEGLDEIELVLVENDMLFDNKMRLLLKNGYQVVVDPIFDNSKELVKGILIDDINSIIASQRP